MDTVNRIDVEYSKIHDWRCSSLPHFKSKSERLTLLLAEKMDVTVEELGLVATTIVAKQVRGNSIDTNVRFVG